MFVGIFAFFLNVRRSVKNQARSADFVKIVGVIHWKTKAFEKLTEETKIVRLGCKKLHSWPRVKSPQTNFNLDVVW